MEIGDTVRRQPDIRPARLRGPTSSVPLQEPFEHGLHVALGQFLAHQIAAAVRSAQEPQQWALVLEAQDLNLVAQFVAVKSACRGEDHAVPSAPLQFVPQPQALRRIDLLELEKVRPYCQHRRRAAG